MDRNLAMEVVRVTEAAALACARLMGRGDANAADHAAVEAMRHAFLGGVLFGAYRPREMRVAEKAARTALAPDRGRSLS